MFIDYLKLSYLLPTNNAERKPGWHLAHQLVTRIREAGEVKVAGETHSSVQFTPDGVRIALDWGGSVLPLDIADTLQAFRRFNDWTVSRIDLAENVDHLARDQVYTGKTQIAVDWWELQHADHGTARNWTGCGIGRRGGGSAYCRIYDARKHKEGHAAKLSRFGTFEFWRVEYELGREYFRRKSIDTFNQITDELLADIWANETHLKGVCFPGTSEYRQTNLAPASTMAAALKDHNRAQQVCQLLAKMDHQGLESVRAYLAARQKDLDEGRPSRYRPTVFDPQTATRALERAKSMPWAHRKDRT